MPWEEAAAGGGGGGVSQGLLAAAYVAAAHRCDRVVWPVQSPAPVSGEDDVDLDRIAADVDRALLVSRLVALDADEHGRPGLRIETPYVDLSDRQLAELAFDMDVPVHLCWWWEGESGAAERERWLGTLRAVGWRAPETGIGGTTR
jgi:hypothetical protein